MDEAPPIIPEVEPVAPRPSEPLPPHPAFATVVKVSRTHSWIWLGLLIILLLGGIYGVYYWQHKQVNTLQSQKLAADKAIDSLNNQIVQQKQAATSSQATVGDNQNVFKVPELGIQITVPASLKTISYHYINNAFGKTVNMSTPTLTNLSLSCTETSKNDIAEGSALGGLFRGSGTGTSTPNSSVIKQYSSYYIAYVPPQGACNGVGVHNPTIVAVQSLETADLKASFSTIVPAVK
jgi:hypothetical protein